jgi:asparagine synthase (glutamine-hydrolysing)
MCGIIGVFDQKERTVNEVTLKKMSDAIAHRGPDGEGFFQSGPMSMAHRRLSILDLSQNGAQPMHSHDERWTIIFNGCIYNFKELRQELESKGAQFQSTSDTEVIIEGIAHEGSDFLKRLNGMFALAIYDNHKEELIISRDRYGQKPLYYWYNGSTLVFASEIKALIAHPGFEVKLNPRALNEYFTFQNLFRFHTMFEGVYLLPPANIVRFDSKSTMVKHHSWWDYDFSQPDEQLSAKDAEEETLRLFRQAVERQLVADTPVGAYLSGGMDSGSVTAVASTKLNRLSTFTCGFDLSAVTGVESNYDERRDAELMASYFKTEHYEQVIRAGDLAWSLPRVVHHLEDLRMGMSYPNYYISGLASKFVKVCLQGTGGDELFGGYPWRYYRVFDSIGKQDYFDQYYGFWQRLVPDEDKPKLFTSSIDISDKWSTRQIFENVFLFNDKLKYDSPEEHIQNSLYFEIKTFLHGLLVMGDKLSMANGLEERFPFLDNDLVDWAQKIPVRHKLGNLEQMKVIDEDLPRPQKKRIYQEYSDGKNVLRNAMRELLPDSIIDRKKQGFSAPDENWYRGENADYIKSLLLAKDTISTEYIQGDYIRQTIEEHFDRKANHRLRIWSFMNFEWWCRIFLDGQTYT